MLRTLAPMLLASVASLAVATEREAPATFLPAGETIDARPLRAVSSATVRFEDLQWLERLRSAQGHPPVRPLLRDEEEQGMEQNESLEPGAGILGLAAPTPMKPFGFAPFAPSPVPSQSFMGLDDIPMVDSSFIVIPPDVGGAVGQTKIFQGSNNNYRILNKATGAVLNTIGTATFWSPVEPGNLLTSLTDPRTVYDPYNNRFIAVIQSVNTNGDVLVAVSQTGDPAGLWFMYRFTGFAASYLIDYPIVGFNKNWITVTINRYTSAGAFSVGICLAVNYPLARTGSGSATLFTPAAGTHFCTSPAVTYSATEDTLFLVTHLSSAGATYAVDRITGTSAAPVYTSGGTNTRPGGGWVQPSGNIQPQSAPVSGTSACGATPCPIETQDAQVRSAPVYRNGLLWYAQTIGLPAGAMTHTGAQWTRITPSTTPAFSDGGRIEDPTATATNGGKWYDNTHLSVNANNDVMVGYTQFSSAQHPSAGYSMRLAGDAAGTMRDPVIAHAGEDYYHKTFSTTTGRNRWGDFSTVQVDPNDDMTLWKLQEYAKARPGTDDGNTGANSSRWSTWWAAVAPPNVTIDAGPSQNEGNSGTTAFPFTVRLSSAYGLPITVSYHTSDGSATTADNDYQPVTSSVIIPAGSTTAPISINVVGDTSCEPNETFSVVLTGADNSIPLGATTSSTGTILSDEIPTITASAGTGGSISPSGSVAGTCGGSQAFTITPDACHLIADVLVDGVSQGAIPTYTFNSLAANHTISASFAVKLQLSETHVDAACHGGSSGTVDLTVTGAALPITYAWSNGATTEDLTGLAAGNYSVTVTDANSCSGNLNVSVGEPAALALSDTHGNVTTCGGTNGSIDLTVAGGTSPYGYSWSNGATTEDLSGLAAGGYTVTVTDAHGCQDQRLVTITEPGAPSASETHVDVACHGGSTGSVDLTLAGGTGPFTYAWSNGATSEDLTGVAAGHYTVTVTDANGCHAGISADVSEPAALGLSQTHTDVCTGGTDGTVDLTVAGGTSPYGYAWSNGATTEDLSGLAAGGYNVTVTDAHGCTAPLSVTIAVTEHSITSTAGTNGTISPLGTTSVACGTNKTYTITPDAGYGIDHLTVDGSPAASTTSYTFTNVTADHTIDVTFVASDAVALGPVRFALGGVMPNPARGAMQVPFGVASEAAVRVTIVDLQGREVAVLAEGAFAPGWHFASWNGRTAGGTASAGLYFVRYRAGGRTVTRRFALAR